MTDDLNQGAVADIDTTSVEPAAPSRIGDIAARAIEVAQQRQADREAGKDVSAELPSITVDRNRDKQGKFAPRAVPEEEPAAKDAKPAKEPEKTPQTTANDIAAAPAPQAAPALQPHPRWSDADKATFTRLPLEAQKSILDMAGRQEADYTKKTMEIAEQRKHVEPILQALNPHTDYLNQVGQQFGTRPAQMLGTLVATERTLRTGSQDQRAQTFANLLAAYPVDLQLLNRAIGQAPPAQTTNQPVQVPEPLLRELHQLRQRQAEFDQFRQVTQQDREQQSIQAAQQQIEAFTSAKDEHGQPKYPHFEAVRGFMAPHVQAGRSFEEAYAMAAKPITDAIAARDVKANADHEAAEAQARADAEAADKARAASVARARQASGPHPSASRPGMTPSRDISAIAWESMRKAGLAT